MNNEEEIWKDVLDYEGLYQISNMGRFQSCDRYVKGRYGNIVLKKGKLINPHATSNGYFNARFYKDKKVVHRGIHRAVAEAFLYFRRLPDELDVHHIDKNKKNNCAKNLMVLTEKEHNIIESHENIINKQKEEKEKFLLFLEESRLYQQTLTTANTTVDEMWSAIPGFEGWYEISTWGNVKSLDRQIIYKNQTIRWYKGKTIKLTKDLRGNPQVTIHKNNCMKSFKLSRLVALVFIPNVENKPHVHHKDGDILNNHVSNLEWITPENHIEKHRLMGRYLLKSGENGVSPRKRFLETDIRLMRNLYKSQNYTQTELAKQFNCNVSVISSILNYRTWKHLI